MFRVELRKSLEHCQRNIFFCDILEQPVWTHVGGVYHTLFFGHKRLHASLAPESMSKINVNSKSVRLVSHEFAVRALEHLALVGNCLLGARRQTDTACLAAPEVFSICQLGFKMKRQERCTCDSNTSEARTAQYAQHEGALRLPLAYSYMQKKKKRKRHPYGA